MGRNKSKPSGATKGRISVFSILIPLFLIGSLASCSGSAGSKETPATPSVVKTAPAKSSPAPVIPEPKETPVAPAPVVPAPVAPAPAAPKTEVSYASCAAAKAAGAAPIQSGQPGYSKKLDKDGDGIACDK